MAAPHYIEANLVRWEQADASAPTARMIAQLCIGGAHLHLEAIEVTDDRGLRSRLAYLQPLLDDLLDALAQRDFQVATIDGRRYVIFAHPHQRESAEA